MAKVPERFIREKAIDLEGEAIASLGCGVLAGKNRIKPLSIGVLSLLELLDNKLIKGEEATWFDYGVIYYLNDLRQEAVEDVADYTRGFREGLERKVERYIKKKKIRIQYMSKIKDTIDQAFTGFDMLPQTGSGGGAFLFGADALAGMAVSACKNLGQTYKEIFWDVPLSLIGHVVAINAVQNGAKGIGRRKDTQHLLSIFKKCKQWDSEKKMYPWQWLEPNVYKLEFYQDSKEIKQDFEKRLKEFLNAKVNG